MTPMTVLVAVVVALFVVAVALAFALLAVNKRIDDAIERLHETQEYAVATRAEAMHLAARRRF